MNAGRVITFILTMIICMWLNDYDDPFKTQLMSILQGIALLLIFIIDELSEKK